MKVSKTQLAVVACTATVSVVAAIAVFLYFYFRKTDMKLSYKGRELLKRFEGLRLTAYQCSAGVWTIGYGHTKGVKEGDVITEAEAESMLTEDVQDAESTVNWQGLEINQNQFDALVCFVFNLGAGNFKKSALLKKIKENPNDPTIEAEFQKWINAGGKPVAGLRNRRTAEAQLYFA